MIGSDDNETETTISMETRNTSFEQWEYALTLTSAQQSWATIVEYNAAGEPTVKFDEEVFGWDKLKMGSVLGDTDIMNELLASKAIFYLRKMCNK